jgi:hypothetical protein
MLMFKAAGAVLAILAAAAIASRQDIMRYVKIRQMSAGRGHPEYVPAQGRKAYPQAEHPTLATRY